MNFIAEFGCNWKDDFTFMDMLEKCKDIGIKYVKLQLWEKRQVPLDVWDMYIDQNRAKTFFDLAKSKGIELFFTPFYPEAVHICEEIGVNYYKVRYKDRGRYDLYQKITKTEKLVFVSCPYMLDTIWRGSMRARYLFCIPEYPANHRYYIEKDYERFDGISDHTRSTALLKWSKNQFEWFEKHVCLDKDCYEAPWSVELDKLEGIL